MDGLKKGITISVLTLQFVVPILVLAQGASDPAVSDFCGVITLIQRITRILLVLLVILAVVFVIMAAFKYLTASGDAEKVKAANHQILYAVVAIAVGLLAGVIPVVVKSIIGGSEGDCPTVLKS